MVVRNRTPAHTKWANASFIAANLNDFNTGWAFVQGSCGGANFTRGLGSPKKTCGRLTVKTTFSGASFTVGNWTLTVHGNYVYGPGPSTALTSLSRPVATRPRARCRTVSSDRSE